MSTFKKLNFALAFFLLGNNALALEEHHLTFWVSAYIPMKHPTFNGIKKTKKNNIYVIRLSDQYPTLTKFIPEAFKDNYYATDNRINSPIMSSSFRMQQSFRVKIKGRNINVFEEKNKTMETHVIDFETGKILKSKKSKTDGMRINHGKLDTMNYEIKLKGSAKNPFFVGYPAPSIDMSTSIKYNILTRKFDIYYSHGCFPAFEMYILNEKTKNTHVVFQDNIKNGCTLLGLIDLGVNFNTVKGSRKIKLNDLKINTNNTLN